MTTATSALAELLRSANYVDLSPTIENGMPRWVTHPPLIVNPTVNHDHDDYYCQTISLAEHTGSHIDAPAHIHKTMMDATIDTVPVQTFLAPAKVFDVRPLGLGPGDLLTADMLRQIDDASGAPLQVGDVALVNFGWWERYWFVDHRWRWYSENTPGLSEDACAWLTERRPVAVGADNVAFDIALHDGVQVQKSYGHDDYFLPNSIYIIECLANLDQLPREAFFMAFPLKIDRGSGSPVRAVGLTFPRGT
ncbi:cyclase family protein [Micromonospora sp. NPDC005206]|uniref:cyclase family protein n=1 Tax=Micromonospora sp. NPDC005206 TaxID=3157022 RepID=UPI00339F97E3